MSLIDLLAILPFYIEILAGQGGNFGDTRIVRIVRLIRVFRVLKLATSGRFSKMQVRPKISLVLTASGIIRLQATESSSARPRTLAREMQRTREC